MRADDRILEIEKSEKSGSITLDTLVAAWRSKRNQYWLMMKKSSSK